MSLTQNCIWHADTAENNPNWVQRRKSLVSKGESTSLKNKWWDGCYNVLCTEIDWYSTTLYTCHWIKRSVGGLHVCITSEVLSHKGFVNMFFCFHFKVQERTSTLENCPWCSSKGLVYGLRSYPINFAESITLCTNPPVCTLKSIIFQPCGESIHATRYLMQIQLGMHWYRYQYSDSGRYGVHVLLNLLRYNHPIPLYGT